MLGSDFKNAPQATENAADREDAAAILLNVVIILAKPVLIAGHATTTITTMITIITRAVRKLIPACSITS